MHECVWCLCVYDIYVCGVCMVCVHGLCMSVYGARVCVCVCVCDCVIRIMAAEGLDCE